jgi:hypothetical protein
MVQIEIDDTRGFVVKTLNLGKSCCCFLVLAKPALFVFPTLHFDQVRVPVAANG